MSKKRKLSRMKTTPVPDHRNESHAEREPGIASASADRSGQEGQEKVIEDDGHIMLPSYLPWVVALATSVVRVVYVTNPKNWWVLHPDEIFQSMEVAHSEVYGYGLRPYEFMSPATGDNLSHYQLVEQQLGMHAMRSPLMPQFYMLVAALCSVLGFELNPYIMWRVIHVMVTSCLPVAMSKFTMAVTKSPDVGNIAAVLCALSSHLNVFGTHTLVNSFVSPFLFWALAAAVKTLEESCLTSSKVVPGNCERENPEKPLSVYEGLNGHTACRYTSNGHANGNTKDHLNGIRNGHSIELSNGHSTQKQFERTVLQNETNDTMEERTRSTNNCHLLSVDKNSHLSQQNDEIGKGTCQNSKTDNSFIHDITAMGPTLDLRKHIAAISLISGLVLILSVYIRPDAVLLVAIFCGPPLSGKSIFKLARDSSCRCFVYGGVIGLSIAICNDTWFYGRFTLSPMNWVNFNVISGRSGHLFGESDFLFYFRDSFIYISSVVYVFIILLGFILLPAISLLIDNVFEEKFKYLIHISKQLKLYTSSLANLRHFHRFTVYAGLLLAIYSCAGHKEKRFLHDAVVLSLASAACAVEAAVGSGPISRLFSRRKTLAVILLAFAAIEWNRFQSASRSTNEEWPYKVGERDFSTNECLHFISQQRDVTGLFMEKNILEAGSFSILHKKVPMLFLFGKVHIEFTSSDLISQNRSCFHGGNCNVSFYSLNRVSDLIHERNHEYLKKKIIESTHYNYAIVSSGKSFFYPAFHKVLARNNMSVWRRTFDAEAENGMARSCSQIPIGGINATIMELEAEILKQMGSYSTALSRFVSALALVKSKVEIYASMAFCYFKMGDEARMNQVLKTCMAAFNKEDCLQGARVRVSNLLISGLDLTLK